MREKILVALAAFLLVRACVFAGGAVADTSVGLPGHRPRLPCPAAGCASGSCHGFDDVPSPDGVHR